MPKYNARLYSVFVIFSVFAPTGIRLFSLLNRQNTALTIVFYLLVALGILLIGADSYKTKEYAGAFIFNNKFRLDVFCNIAALGFFIDFVRQSVELYFSLQSDAYKTLTYFIPLCFVCLFALISSFYMCVVSLSFSGKKHDFRSLKIVHIAPMLWAVARILILIEKLDGTKDGINSVLKYIMLPFALCFFYCFALEIANRGRAKRFTIFFARAYSYLSLMYFADSLMTVMFDSADVFGEDSFFAITSLMLCGFAFFFEKNIISHNTDME